MMNGSSAAFVCSYSAGSAQIGSPSQQQRVRRSSVGGPRSPQSEDRYQAGLYTHTFTYMSMHAMYVWGWCEFSLGASDTSRHWCTDNQFRIAQAV